MNDLSEAVNRIYQETLATFGPDGGQLRDVMEAARPRVLAEIREGHVDVNLDRLIDAELLAADQSNRKLADRVIAQLANGFDAVDMTLDPMLDVVVTLGGGLRKQWRDITGDDLILMDQLRYENVRKQQAAYDIWRQSYSPVSAALRRYSTVGDAYASGAFTALPFVDA